MRQIEKMMVQAVNNGVNFALNNTRVDVCSGGIYVYLHNNCIYHKENDGTVNITLHGWNTATTRSRLHALGVNICQKNWTPYLNGQPIDSYKWYQIN